MDGISPSLPHEAAARRALVDAFHILAARDLGSGVAGHLTMRHPDGTGFWTHRFGLAFEEITEDDLVLCDYALRSPRALPINPTLHIHAQIYLARPDVRAIAHSHGPAVIALSATGAEFVACSQMSGIFVGEIATFDEEELIVLRAEEGAAMAAVLGPRSALILKNHGSLIAAAGIEELVMRMIVLEDAADIQLRAMAAGGTHGLSARAADQVKRFVLSPQIVQHYWEYERRRVARAR